MMSLSYLCPFLPRLPLALRFCLDILAKHTLGEIFRYRFFKKSHDT